MSWFRRKPPAPPADWVKTGNERWVVVKQADNVVREALEREWIDLDSGAREWRGVWRSTFYGDPRLGMCDIRSWQETRVRTLPSKELAS